MAEDRYYVQGETVRGEPRVYWVCDRSTRLHNQVSYCTTNRRQAVRWCEQMNETAKREAGDTA